MKPSGASPLEAGPGARLPHRALRAAIVALGVLAVGCGARPPRSFFPTAEAALGRMKATYDCVNGLQGTAKINHFSEKGRIRGDVVLLAVNPDRVRFDVVSPFGATVYALTSDGHTFNMIDIKERLFLYGPANACNLARLTRVPVPAHALVDLLRGEAPVLVHGPAAASITWESDGFYRILVNSSRDAQEEIHLGIRPDNLDKSWQEQRTRVLDVRVTQRGIDLYHADFHDYAPIRTAPPRVDPDGLEPTVAPSGLQCEAELPRALRVRAPGAGQDQDVEFSYREAKWNPPLVPGAFELTVPDGVRRMFSECTKGGP